MFHIHGKHLPAARFSTSSLAAPSVDKGGSTGYTAPGDRQLVWLGCCQKDCGSALSFMGRGSETTDVCLMIAVLGSIRINDKRS